MIGSMDGWKTDGFRRSTKISMLPRRVGVQLALCDGATATSTRESENGDTHARLIWLPTGRPGQLTAGHQHSSPQSDSHDAGLRRKPTRHEGDVGQVVSSLVARTAPFIGIEDVLIAVFDPIPHHRMPVAIAATE